MPPVCPNSRKASTPHSDISTLLYCGPHWLIWNCLHGWKGLSGATLLWQPCCPETRPDTSGLQPPPPCPPPPCSAGTQTLRVSDLISDVMPDSTLGIDGVAIFPAGHFGFLMTVHIRSLDLWSHSLSGKLWHDNTVLVAHQTVSFTRED